MKKKFTQKLVCLVLGIVSTAPLLKAGTPKIDYTDLLINPSFELTLDGNGNEIPMSGTVRFCPYGWNDKVIYDGNDFIWNTNGVLGQSYGMNNNVNSISREGDFGCWMMPAQPLDFFELYQEIEVGNGEGQLPPGEYVLSCRLAVMELGNRRYTNQRFFATTTVGGDTISNKVQYYGRETDYEFNLTEGENATYADWKPTGPTNGDAARVKPMSITMSVADGETLRLGIRTSKYMKDGTTGTGNDVGYFKTDDFRIRRIGAPGDYTHKIINPSFEYTDADKTSPARMPDADGTAGDWTRFCPYGWSDKLVYMGAEVPWSDTENSKPENQIGEIDRNFGRSYGVNNDGVEFRNGADGIFSCWISANDHMPEFTLYQTINDLPAGKYQLSCVMIVEVDRFRTQRLFANNCVQFYGKEEHYDLEKQLTAEELAAYKTGNLTITYANYEIPTGKVFLPMSLEVTIGESEALTLGVKTSGLDKTGATVNGNAGIVRVDDFRLVLLDAITTSVPSSSSHNLVAFVSGNKLCISGAERGKQLSVFDISGVLVHSQPIIGENIMISLKERGIYLVKVNGNVLKVKY